MGFGSSLKKIGKVIVSSVANPWNLVNPIASVKLAVDKTEDVVAKEQEKKDFEKVQKQQNITDTANKKFNDELENERTNGYKSNFIFAGVLGDNEKIGLGGIKNLLGL